MTNPQIPVHIPVLGEVAPKILVTDPDGIYIDATFGRGGHSHRILDALSAKGRLIAFDRDPQAVEVARQWTDPRFCIIHSAFSHMLEALMHRGISRVCGILMDIGVSSPQIDEPERGFSFRSDGPLDMRMDTSQGVTAAQWLAQATKKQIEQALREYGEERFAGRIAQAIVDRREDKPFTRTADLAAFVAESIPRSRQDPHQHPATRTFQALRIVINGELDELRQALQAAGALLQPDGRLAVISFQSLEDRIVKRFFEAGAHPEREIDPRIALQASALPAPWWQAPQRVKPDAEECRENPRARSATLRWAARTSRCWAEECRE